MCLFKIAMQDLRSLILRLSVVVLVGFAFQVETLFSKEEKGNTLAVYSSFTSDEEKTSPVQTITIDELREHVFFLASDSLGGRVVGTPGYQTAVHYGVREFRAAGLNPILIDSLGKETYLQPVPFSRRAKGDSGRLVIKTPEGEVEFAEGESFKFLAFKPRDLLDNPFSVVFVGFGIEESDVGWNDYEGLNLHGKIAVMLPGAPLENGKPVFPEDRHKLYSTGDGDGNRFHALFKRGPAALLLLANQWRSQNWDKFGNAADKVKLLYIDDRDTKKTVRSTSKHRSIQMVVRPEVLEALFEGQEYSPNRMNEFSIKDYKTFDLKDASVRYQLQFSGGKFHSYNAVAMVEGSDPELRKQVITVGAHLDHVSPRNGQICNGADDNASGSTGVLEIAEAVAMNPPRRSVIFILYTAEEIGLHGSRHFVHHCPVPLDDVLVNINLDMIGRTGKGLENRAHNVVVPKDTYAEFKDVIETVNERSVRWPLMFKTYQQIGGGSDHLSFHERGIPAVFFFSGHHEDLHRPSDDPEKIDYEKMQKICQLIYELVMEFGNRDEPVFSFTNQMGLVRQKCVLPFFLDNNSPRM
jgi:acetylornithine deacetylase/succinyl-diaminopimelate desuccinylase-like protein